MVPRICEDRGSVANKSRARKKHRDEMKWKKNFHKKSDSRWCNSSLNNNIKHNMWMFSGDVENGDRRWRWCDKSILSAQTCSSRRQKRLEFESVVMSNVLKWFQMHIISITYGYAQHSMLKMWANIENEVFFLRHKWTMALWSLRIFKPTLTVNYRKESWMNFDWTSEIFWLVNFMKMMFV